MAELQTYYATLKYPPMPDLKWLSLQVQAYSKRQASQRAINAAAKFWDLSKASKEKIEISSLVIKEHQGRLI